MLQIHNSPAGDGVAESCGAGGPDAVEHVGAEGDGDEQVFGVALVV